MWIPTATADTVPHSVDGPAKVTTKTLQSGSTYLTSHAYADALGRAREAQVTAPGDLAYLTLRQANKATDGGRLYEAGVIGHGPGGDELAARVTESMRTWDREYRSRDVQFEIQPLDSEPIEQRPGRFAFDTRINRIVIEWQ